MVLALLICAMSLLLGISACSLITLAAKNENAALEKARARMNAIAAARIALGELQGAVGPDRRVTANAGIFSEPGKIPQPWCGVWRTDRRKSESANAPALIHRNSDGALVDDRFTSDASRPYDRRAECLRWLVSGDATDPFATATSETLTLLDATTGTPAVRVKPDTDGYGAGFAWFVSDENQKACIRVPNTAPDDTGATSPAGTGYTLIPGWNRTSPVPTRPLPTLDSLTVDGLLTPESLNAVRHDLCTETVRVYADALHGGLCRDMTPYFTGNAGEDAPRDDDPILGESVTNNPFAKHGPRFGMLKNWAGLRNTGPLKARAGSRYASTGGKPATLFHDGTHPDLPDAAAPISPTIAPVVSEAAVYRRISYNPARKSAAGGPWLRLHLHPRIVLWNPYAETLAPARYLVHLRINGSPVFRLLNMNRTVTGAITGWRVYTPALVNYAVTQGSLLFVIDCPAIPAGESRLFMPERTAPLYGKTAGSGNYLADYNRLVVTTQHTNANFYLEDTDAFEDKTLNALAGLSADNERWRMENSAAEDYAVALSLMDSAGPVNWASLRTLPTLRYISASVKCGSGTTPVPGSPAGRAEALLSGMDTPPPRDTRDGIRLRRFFETTGNRNAYSPHEHMDTAPMADMNPLAVFQWMHPLANATPAPTSANRRMDTFGVFTRDESDPTVDWDAIGPKNIVAHPFGLPSQYAGCDKIVLAGPPEEAQRIHSLAELSYVPAAPYAWNPARTLGESGITPITPPHATCLGDGVQTFAGTPTVISDAMRVSEAPAAPRIYDVRYELNHALWDRYVCLGGNAAARRKFAAHPESPPGEMTDGLTPVQRDSMTDLQGPKSTTGAAAILAQNGAFNINSTSVLAWKNLLATARGVTPDGKGISDHPGESPYARFKYNTGHAASGETRETEPAFGWGTRSLSDDDIDRLATEIVEEVKRRAPFLGLADFINRRLTPETVSVSPESPSTNSGGVIHCAIGRAKLNGLTSEPRGRLSRNATLSGCRFRSDHQSHSRFEGACSVLSQADLLQSLSPKLTARGDSFKIVVVGIAAHPGGDIRAKAEITVRRIPTPLKPDSLRPDEPDAHSADTFGRRLEVTGWKWLDDEVSLK